MFWSRAFQSPPEALVPLMNAVVGLTLAGLLLTKYALSAGGVILLLSGGLLCTRFAQGMDRRDYYVLAMLAAIPLADALNMAFTGWGFRYLDKPVRLLYSFLIYFGLSRCGVAHGALFYGAAVGAATALGFAAYQVFVLHLARAHGVTNEIPFGNFALLLGGVALIGGIGYWRATRDIKHALIAAVAFACGLGASLLSGSRGGWLALPVIFWIVGYAAAPGINGKQCFVGAVTGCAVLLAAYVLVPGVSQRMDEGLDNVRSYANGPAAVDSGGSSVGQRLQMWRFGAEQFIQHPLLGIGPAHLAEEKHAAIAAGTLNPKVERHEHLHNELLTRLASGGLLSASGVLAFWTLSLRYFYRRLRTAQADPEALFFAATGLCVVVATALFAMTDSLFGVTFGASALAFCVAVPAGALAHRERLREAAGGFSETISGKSTR